MNTDFGKVTVLMGGLSVGREVSLVNRGGGAVMLRAGSFQREGAKTQREKIQRKGAKAQRAQRFFVWAMRHPQALHVTPNHIDFSLRPLRLRAFALDFQGAQP